MLEMAILETQIFKNFGGGGAFPPDPPKKARWCPFFLEILDPPLQ